MAEAYIIDALRTPSAGAAAHSPPRTRPTLAPMCSKR